MDKHKLTPEEKKMITTAMSVFLAEGYNKTRKRIPGEEFDKVMTQVVDEILYIQAHCGRPISVVGAGLLMLLPDPKYPNDKNFKDLVKAGIVFYLMQKLPDIEKEFGIKVQK